jgi:hypothetical protein
MEEPGKRHGGYPSSRVPEVPIAAVLRAQGPLRRLGDLSHASGTLVLGMASNGGTHGPDLPHHRAELVAKIGESIEFGRGGLGVLEPTAGTDTDVS